jgi:hypothetical protein
MGMALLSLRGKGKSVLLVWAREEKKTIIFLVHTVKGTV